MNLRRFERDEVVVPEGDAFDLLPAGALAGRRIGVYYYDARHRYEPQLEALVLIEPFLAEQALIIIDDADWDDVNAAGRHYLAGQEKARELYTIRGEDHGQPVLVGRRFCSCVEQFVRLVEPEPQDPK